MGLSVPFLGRGGAGDRGSEDYQPGARRRPVRTIRAGILVPTGAINPVTVEDEGGLELVGNIGEFLVLANDQLHYQPWLATSWSPNAHGTVWTFKIRQGVKLNNGTPMTVDDVVYSFKYHSNPKNGSIALSVFSGILVPDGVVKVDDGTIAFHLEAADGNFVDAVSDDNYSMIIVPNNYDFANYEKDFIGTGHFKMSSYTPNVGATYVPNPYYWGKPALPSEVQWTFYASEQPMVAALEANEIDTLDQFTTATSPQLLNGNYNIINLQSSLHRELSMRTDLPPFNNKYVRQAMGHLLNRPQLVKSLFKGEAVIGNDSPFAPIFTSTVGPPAVPQRAQNIKLARQLLAKGGVPRGFKATLVTELRQEMPQLAQYIKTWAAEAGVTIDLTIETPTKYYGTGVYGKSDWLDGEMSMVDYGARSVPNVFLGAPLQTHNSKTGAGAWNAARFATPSMTRCRRRTSRQWTSQVSGNSPRISSSSSSTRRRSSSRTSTTSSAPRRRM